MNQGVAAQQTNGTSMSRRPPSVDKYVARPRVSYVWRVSRTCFEEHLQGKAELFEDTCEASHPASVVRDLEDSGQSVHSLCCCTGLATRNYARACSGAVYYGTWKGAQRLGSARMSSCAERKVK